MVPHTVKSSSYEGFPCLEMSVTCFIVVQAQIVLGVNPIGRAVRSVIRDDLGFWDADILLLAYSWRLQVGFRP